MVDEPVTVVVLVADSADVEFVREALGEPVSGETSDTWDDRPDRFELRRARTLEEALDRWDEDVDAVVIDLELSDSSGLETVDTLASANRNRDGDANRSAPIVVLSRSGNADAVDAVEALERGVDDVLEKDRVDPGALGRRIRRAIERHDAERARRRRNRELAALLSVVGHEVRNDVAVIEGWTDALEAHVDSTGEAGKEGLDRIRAASESVLRTVETTNDLLDVLDERRAMALRPVDAVAVARAEVKRARTAFPAAEFRLVEDCAADRSVEATELLAAAFRELLANAVRYADEPAPTVVVRIEDRDGAVTVRVIDDGPSVPCDRHEAVFGRGERGLESPEARLGLYFVDTLVTEYGGTVDVADTEPGRTSIELTLETATSEPVS